MTKQELTERFWKAETAEEIAEICRLEAEMNGGPWFDDRGAERCPDCGSTEAGSCFYCKMD